MFKNLRLGVKLAVGFGLVVALMAVIAVVSYTRLATLNDSIKIIVGDLYPKTVWSQDVINGLNEAARVVRLAALLEKPEDVQRELARIPAISKGVSDALEKLDKTITSERGRELFKQLTAVRSVYAGHLNQSVRLAGEGKDAELLALVMGDMRTSQSAYFDALKPSREIPRLCRGGSRSLTFAGVHPETSRVSRQAHSLKGVSRWTSLKA